MSIQAPQGILNIPNAILRVGKLSVDEVVGADTILNTVARNTILLVDDEAYHENKNWSLKLPNAWAGEFECNTASAGNYSEFNFYNEGASSNAQGYNLTFNDTAVQLRYDGALLKTGTLASTITGTGVKKVRLMFERTILSVTVDGTLVFTHDDTVGPRPRVYSTTAGGFLNFFTNGGALKNLKIVNEKWMSDGTSNIAYVGGGEVAVGQALAFNRVSNVSQIKVDSNVVTEYTGPHDRPLRKYPEVAMTSASQDGYVVTQSGGTAYLALDEDTSTRWYSGSDSHYDSAGGAAITDPNNANVAPRLDTNTDYGDWLAIEVPTGIKLESFKLMRFDGGFPSSGTLYAKNSSGDSWTEIYRYDGYTGPSTGDQQDWTHVFHVNSTIVYKNFALVGRVREAGQQGSPGLSLKDWELYGYEEGGGSLDTTLKTVYNVPATTGTQLEVYYDGRDYSQASDFTGTGGVVDKVGGDQDGTAGTGVGFDTAYKAFVFDGTANGKIVGTHNLSGTAPVNTCSAWFKKTSSTGNYSYISRFGTNATSSQIAISIDERSSNLNKLRFEIYGGFTALESELTITENVWYHVAGVYSGGTWNTNNCKLYLNGVEISLTNSTNTTTTPSITDTTLVLGSDGNSNSWDLDGSIANFRLYSKALNADQVKELYDYQKDYFLGSKSQVTLYKGHLGVGVTEPSGQLELAGDERIQEYPPRALTGYSTHIEGHGVFDVNFANWYSGNTPWGMYKKNNTTGGQENIWYGPYEGNNGYSGGHVYSGTDFAASTTSGLFLDDVDGNRYYGAWTTIAMPYDIYLKQIHIYQGASSEGLNSRCVTEDGVILGSENGHDWYHVHTFTGLQYGGSAGSFSYSAAGERVVVNAKRPYKYYALVTTRTLHYDFTVIIGELRWFGTPGPTTLDKGSLSLGRSLDVPRISRYDVDTETPRPEKLVVDFDTTVNSSPTDISGRGNHGVFYGTNMNYSSADKAFAFNGTDDYIEGTQSTISGNNPYSFSVWVKPDSHPSSGFVGVFEMGTRSDDDSIGLYFDTGNIIHLAYGNNLATTTPTPVGNWTHIIGTYTSGDRKVYANGVLLGQDTYSGLTLAGTKLVVGANSAGSQNFDGQISNFKIYNVALEASEVKKLYRLGRTGRSMVISDTAVGIGKVPEAQLDVRGSGGFTGSLVTGGSSYVGGLPSSSFDYLNPSLHVNSLPKNMLRLQVRNGGEIPSLDDFPNISIKSIMSSGSDSHLDEPEDQYYDITKDPYDRSCIVFRCRGTNGGVCGGWGKLNVRASYRRSYMSVVFVKRSGTASSGATFYHGCSTNNTANFSGSQVTNPYFHFIGYNSLPSGVWCVSIGFVHFKGATSGYNTGKAGMYRLDTMTKIDTGTEFTFYDEYDEQAQRVFLYNNTTSGGYLDFWNPGWFDTQTIFPETDILNVFTRDLIETSDDRLKSDERFIRKALDSIMKLKPQLYKKHLGLDSVDETVQEESGLMAQDIYYNTPELRHVVKPGDDYGAINSIVPVQSIDPNKDPDYSEWGKNPAKVDYRGLIPYTIKAIQELNTEMTRSKFRIVGIPYSRLMDYTGLCVRSTTRGEVELTTFSNDKSVVGVISTTQNINEYEDSEVLVDIVGKGGIWVIDTGGVQNGDYLTTSNIVSGYAQVQLDDLVHSYTVAKALEDVDFTEVQKPIRIIKQELSNVSTWIKREYRKVTKDTYDKLDENVRCITTTTLPATDDEIEEQTLDTHNEIIIHESRVQIPGYELEVRQELVNVLDEHGQIQWEDDPSGATEKAYKIRYLDADGNITDEANHVYKAAFVGCTYHCG
jgi:hypothetical protein